MTGRLLDLSLGMDGKQRATIAVDGDMRETYDALKDAVIDITIKKHRKQRSLDANAYCWVLIDHLAEALGIPKLEVYREAIRSIGGVSETVCVRDNAVERLTDGWQRNGIGWITDTMPSKLDGCTNVVLYYGSSTYDTKQMHDLINVIIEACRAQGIETATPAELAALEAAWNEHTGGKNND